MQAQRMMRVEEQVPGGWREGRGRRRGSLNWCIVEGFFVEALFSPGRYLHLHPLRGQGSPPCYSVSIQSYTTILRLHWSKVSKYNNDYARRGLKVLGHSKWHLVQLASDGFGDGADSRRLAFISGIGRQPCILRS